MKIISWNIRGMGGKVKKRELKGLISLERPNFLCIQETRASSIEAGLCRFIWSGLTFDWVHKSACGRSGGLLSIWNSSIFQRTEVTEGEGFLCIKGAWGNNATPCAIVNIYSPCNMQGKRALWKALKELMGDDPDRCWCLAGDFNAVCSRSERKGRGFFSSSAECREFEDFVLSNNLVDLPLLGWKFTCYNRDAAAMSRIDRFLLSESWLQHFNNLSQWACKRSVSDHCPLILKEGDYDWGPKPFRVLDCWHDHPDFAPFVRAKWSSYQIFGKAAYVLKEKLKMLKSDLKDWNKQVFGNLDSNIATTTAALNSLDLEAEIRNLLPEEEQQRRSLTALMWQQKKAKESLLHQKSRFQWLKFGDSNTRFFHKCIQGRRAVNGINGLQVNGSWIDEPMQIKAAAQNHFGILYSGVADLFRIRFFFHKSRWQIILS